MYAHTMFVRPGKTALTQTKPKGNFKMAKTATVKTAKTVAAAADAIDYRADYAMQSEKFAAIIADKNKSADEVTSAKNAKRRSDKWVGMLKDEKILAAYTAHVDHSYAMRAAIYAQDKIQAVVTALGKNVHWREVLQREKPNVTLYASVSILRDAGELQTKGVTNALLKKLPIGSSTAPTQASSSLKALRALNWVSSDVSDKSFALIESKRAEWERFALEA